MHLSRGCDCTAVMHLVIRPYLDIQTRRSWQLMIYTDSHTHETAISISNCSICSWRMCVKWMLYRTCTYLHRTCVLVSERIERTCTRSFVANQQGSPIWRSVSKAYIMTFENTAALPATCWHTDTQTNKINCGNIFSACLLRERVYRVNVLHICIQFYADKQTKIFTKY